MSDQIEVIDWGRFQTKPRLVTAVMQFRAGPGREHEAAEAWAFELTYYFTRGVGEQPIVTYNVGVYTVQGLMQTTHPGDKSPISFFDCNDGRGASLDFCRDPDRMERLRESYKTRPVYFDGRDHS